MRYISSFLNLETCFFIAYDKTSLQFIRDIQSLESRAEKVKALVGFQRPRKGKLSYELTSSSLLEQEILGLRDIFDNIESELQQAREKLNIALRFIRSKK